MSKWYELQDDDIELDGEEFNIWVGCDDFGNNYVTMSFDQVRDMFEKMSNAIVSGESKG